MDAGNLSIVISNELVRAAQDLTLNEKRLLMIGVARLNDSLGIEQLITVTADDYATTYGIARNNAYKALKQAEVKLWERELNIYSIRLRLRWIISVRYSNDEGELLLKFHPDLEPHITNLKTRFTRYMLSRAAEFKSIYSWRLFELLMQFRTTGTVTISLDDFKKTMEVPEAYDRDFGLIRSKVINLALNEIRDKSNLPVTFQTKKAGRKVTALTFTFPTEQQNPLPLPKDEPLKKPAKRLKATEQGDDIAISKNDAKSRLNGIKSMQALSGEPIEKLASAAEIAAFKHYGLI